MGLFRFVHARDFEGYYSLKCVRFSRKMCVRNRQKRENEYRLFILSCSNDYILEYNTRIAFGLSILHTVEPV